MYNFLNYTHIYIISKCIKTKIGKQYNCADIIKRLGTNPSKDLPNMNTFCDWLSETIVISAYDSFFRNYISIVLLSFIVLSSQSQRLFI